MRIEHATTATHTIDGLPAWLESVSYRGDDDAITMRVAVPATSLSLSHLLACEMTADSARALVDALAACIRQSERTMAVIDLDPEPSPFR